MSDVPELDTAELPEELTVLDQILHRGRRPTRARARES